MKKKWFWAVNLLLILCIGAGAAYGIYKVNNKVNTLAALMQEKNSRTGTDRLAYIPDLGPGTEGWKITQFGDAAGEQEMCYTITTDTGLIIVDGGQAYEAPRLREIIAQYGNCVEAWILTHPHSDHITAFMDIYDDLQGIEIHHIYTAEFPEEERMQENAPWDNFEALERFRSMDIPELEYVKEGDRLNLLGLEIEILSAYNDQMDELSNDLMNDGSVMFRITGSRDSMLFCGDVGKSMTGYLVEKYGEALKSDYVQMGHHGFGGPDAEFYELVDPRGAFFDAPAWLMSSDTDRSTREKEDLIQSMGSVVYSYYTAPNQILLR